MSQRTGRINELLQREISDILHSRYRQDAVRITITGADISPDLRNAIIHYSVIGDEAEKEKAKKLFKKAGKVLKTETFKRIQIKYTPEMRFLYDDSPARGTLLIDALDKTAQEDAERDERYK